MDTIRWLMGTKQPLGYVEGDIVYPTHVLDNGDGIRPIILSWALCFNDVLDPEKLHSSLSRLFEIGDWRKFGGRLRIGSGRVLELHAPPEFTAERPAVYYTHQTFNMPIHQHPVASKIPRQTPGRVSLDPFLHDMREFTARPDVPSSVEELTSQDVPVVSLHITSFDDATLVGLSYPHAMIDAVGQGNLLRAWSLVLAGKESEVPPMVDAHRDPLFEAAAPDSKGNPKPFVREREQLNAWGLTKFGLRLVWDIFWEGKQELHTLCLPKELVDRLHSDILEELAARTPEGKGKAWVSPGDALLGLFGQVVARTMNSKGRPMNVINAADMRGRMSAMGNPHDGVHMSGVTGFMTTMTAEEAVGPVSGLAWASRRSILEQMSEEQLVAFMRLIRQQWETGTSQSPMFGPSNAFLYIVTNWARADLFRAASFGPAVIRQGDTSDSRVNPPGEMWMHQPVALKLSLFSRNLLLVLGKDHSKDYWMVGTLKPQAWALLREAVRELEERMGAEGAVGDEL